MLIRPLDFSATVMVDANPPLLSPSQLKVANY